MIRKRVLSVGLFFSMAFQLYSQEVVTEFNALIKNPNKQLVELHFNNHSKEILFRNFQENEISVVRLDDDLQLQKTISGDSEIVLKKFPYFLGYSDAEKSRFYYFLNESKTKIAFAGYNAKLEWKSNDLSFDLKEHKITQFAILKAEGIAYLFGISLKNEAFYMVDLQNPAVNQFKKYQFKKDEFLAIKKFYYGTQTLDGSLIPVISNGNQSLEKTIKQLKLFLLGNNEFALTLDHNEKTTVFLFQSNMAAMQVEELAYKPLLKNNKVRGNSTLYNNKLFQFTSSRKSSPKLVIFSDGSIEKTITVSENTNWNIPPSEDEFDTDDIADKEIGYKKYDNLLNFGEFGLALKDIDGHSILRLGSYQTQVRGSDEGEAFIVGFLFGIVGAAIYLAVDNPNLDAYKVSRSVFSEINVTDSAANISSSVAISTAKDLADKYFNANIEDQPSITPFEDKWYIGTYNEASKTYQIREFKNNE